MKLALALLALCVVIQCNDFLYSTKLNKNFYDSINNMQNQWTSGQNAKFVGMTRDQIKRFMGAKKTPADKKLPVKTFSELHIDAVPATFDARTAWPNCESIKEVRDQSSCGSCWAFGAVEAFSDRICIASGQKLQTRISATDLLACCTECGDGCNGGYPEAAWQYFQQTGAVTGGLYQDKTWCSAYPFQSCEHHVTGSLPDCSTLGEFSTPACPSSCDAGTSYNGTFANDKHFVSSSYSVPSDVASIQQEILTYGPVEIAITVYDDFLTYKSGVYKHVSGSELGGHAVKMLGWGTENGVDYWLVANSWNNGWGDNGFIKIQRGTNECGIEEAVVAGQVKL